MAWMPNYHVSRIISLNNSRSVILEHQMPGLYDDCFARLGAQVYIEEQTSVDQETFRCKRVHTIKVFRTSSFDPMIPAAQDISLSQTTRVSQALHGLPKARILWLAGTANVNAVLRRHTEAQEAYEQ